jgi:hypothetical protein
MHWKITALLGLALASISHYTSAQDQQDNWYQVEIIVFGQSLAIQDTQESWPMDIALAYPPGTIALIDPNAPDVELEPEPQAFLTVPDPSTLVQTQEMEDGTQAQEPLQTTIGAQSLPAVITNNEQQENPDNEIVNETPEGVIDDSEQVAPQPKFEEAFVLLPPDSLELNDTARRIRRGARTRLLTHIGWRQDLTTDESAKSIIISGGEAFGDHH